VPWAALAAVVAAAASLPLVPAPGELLGGGSIGAGPTAGHADIAFTTVRVAKDAKSVHVYADWPARCGDGRVVTANIDRVAPLRADGSFVAAGLVTSTSAVGSFEVEGRLERRSIGGRNIDAGAGSGRAELSARRGAATTCRTSTVRWQVRATPRVEGTPAPKAGAAYFGSDDQTDPVVLRVARNGRSLAQAGIEFGLDCEHRRFLFGSEIVPAARIASNGRFSTVRRYATVVTDPRFGNGRIARYTATFSGRFGASAVAGTLQVEVRVISAGGVPVDTCRSRTTFAASL